MVNDEVDVGPPRPPANQENDGEEEEEQDVGPPRPPVDGVDDDEEPVGPPAPKKRKVAPNTRMN